MTKHVRQVLVLASIAATVPTVLPADPDGKGKEETFRGVVQALPNAKNRVGDWTIDNRLVKVTATTKINQQAGPITVGACVDVRGATNPDRSFAASEITSTGGHGGCPPASKQSDDDGENLEFRATVQSISGNTLPQRWVVGGRSVDVLATTKIEPQGLPPKVGSCVSVKGDMKNGVIQAERVQRLGDGVCGPAAGREDQPKLIGLLESFPVTLVGEWKVAGQLVSVSQDTVLHVDRGALAVNACVEVRGALSGGVLNAQWIEVLDKSECAPASGPKFEMYGVIESVPSTADKTGQWKVSGRTVNVTKSTDMDDALGEFVVGACVEVQGVLRTDGSIDATNLDVKSSNGTCIFRHGVVDAATYASAAISPGQIVSIFGLNIGPATDLPLVIQPGNQIATRLANTRVTFDNVEAPLLLASSGQINAVVPCSVTPGKNATVQVVTNGVWSNVVEVPVVAAWPRVFTLSNSGVGPAAVLNVAPNGLRTVNSARDPAAPGTAIEIYSTGLGVPNVGGCKAGQVMPLSAEVPQFDPVPSSITVTIGDTTVAPLYVGAAPGLAYGVFQINALVPSDAPTRANTPITVNVGTAKSQPGVTIAVRR